MSMHAAGNLRHSRFQLKRAARILSQNGLIVPDAVVQRQETLKAREAAEVQAAINEAFSVTGGAVNAVNMIRNNLRFFRD